MSKPGQKNRQYELAFLFSSYLINMKFVLKVLFKNVFNPPFNQEFAYFIRICWDNVLVIKIKEGDFLDIILVQRPVFSNMRKFVNLHIVLLFFEMH